MHIQSGAVAYQILLNPKTNKLQIKSASRDCPTKRYHEKLPKSFVDACNTWTHTHTHIYTRKSRPSVSINDIPFLMGSRHKKQIYIAAEGSPMILWLRSVYATFASWFNFLCHNYLLFISFKIYLFKNPASSKRTISYYTLHVFHKYFYKIFTILLKH